MAFWLALGVVALMGVGAQFAFAGHYHICCGGSIYETGHALVHGDYTTDNVWHGRSTANNVLTTRYCSAGSVGRGLKGEDYAGPGETCQIMVSGHQFYYQDTENCYSWGYINANDWQNSPHYHNGHNRPCPGNPV